MTKLPPLDIDKAKGGEMSAKKKDKHSAIIPKDLQGLEGRELLEKVEAELKALDEEYIAQIKELKKIGDKTKTKSEFLNEAVKVLLKRTTKFFAHRNDPTFTYHLFKQYYDAAGMPFEMKDVETVRTNMLELGRKLYEIHMRRLKEGGQK